VEGAERVAEARVLRSGIDQPGEAHLVQPPQPLERARLEHPAELAVVAAQLDEAVHRVAEHAVLHLASIAAMLLALAGCGEETISLDVDAACQPGACRVADDYGELGDVGGTADELADQLLFAGLVDD